MRVVTVGPRVGMGKDIMLGHGSGRERRVGWAGANEPGAPGKTGQETPEERANWERRRQRG